MTRGSLWHTKAYFPTLAYESIFSYMVYVLLPLRIWKEMYELTIPVCQADCLSLLMQGLHSLPFRQHSRHVITSPGSLSFFLSFFSIIEAGRIRPLTTGIRICRITTKEQCSLRNGLCNLHRRCLPCTGAIQLTSEDCVVCFNIISSNETIGTSIEHGPLA